jgi:uncharacterized coiled-coil protein SlyX
MNDPKRIEDLERRFDEFEDDINHSLTILLGQAWKHGERLKLLKSTMVERFERLDNRVTEAHKELAELAIKVDRIEKTQNDHTQRFDRLEATQQRQEQLLQAILDRLPPKQ